MCPWLPKPTLLSLETPSIVEESRTNPAPFKQNIILGSRAVWEVEHFENVGKDGKRQIVKIRLEFPDNLES